MVVGQVLPGVDHSVHVCFHQISNDIDVLVASLGRRAGHINQRDDVLMVKEFQKLDLTHNSLCIDKILKGLGHLFDGDLALGGVIIS
jgi:hypothetical protein